MAEAGVLPLKSYLREFYLGAIRRRRCAFAMPLNEESGAIRINLRGREPDGVVEPGEEYQALAEELRDALLELRDTESGISLVSEVLFTRDLVPEATDNPKIPDIFIKWNRTKRMDAVQSERLGRIEMDFWPARSGDHHVDGLVLSNRPIAHNRNGRDGVSVLDLAPTIAALHGVERPDLGADQRLSNQTSIWRGHRANGSPVTRIERGELWRLAARLS